MSKRNSSASLRHSKNFEDEPSTRLFKNQKSLQRPGSVTSVSRRLGGSRSSIDRKADTKDDRASFYNNCRSIYLLVLDDTKEEITSREELTLLLQYAGRNPTQKMIDRIWNEDIDSITFYQFCDILKQENPISRGEILRAFKKIDINNDGFITHDELINVLTMNGERMTKAEVKALMDDADFNGDGKLDYHEFCDMMMATVDKCGKLCGNLSKGGLEKKKEEKVIGKSIVEERKESMKQKEKKSRNTLNESVSKSSIRKKSQTKEQLLREIEMLSDDSQQNALETSAPRIMREPKDLTKWRYCNSKGSVYLEDDGQIESHQYRLLILESTDIFIRVQPVAPKYGKFRKDLLDCDITVFLISEGKDRKLVAFTESKIEKKVCLKATVEAGSYQLLTFSSGVLISQGYSQPRSPAKLVIGEEDNAKFTKACKDTLYEIFYRCDLDGNGFLSRDEFNQFQLKTSGEGCDDDAWEVVKENFEMNNKNEVTPDGFLNLNMMEARDPDGGTDELWVSIESMGYNKSLELVKAFPFHIEVFTRNGDCGIEIIGISNGGKPLEGALIESIKTSSAKKPFRSNKNIILYVNENNDRTTLAVENKTYVPVRIRLMCNKSVNALSKQESLDYVCNLDPREMQIVDHLVPKKMKQEIKIDCEESILK